MSARRPLRLNDKHGRVAALAEIAEDLMRGVAPRDREAAAIFGDAILAFLGSTDKKPRLDTFLGIRADPRSRSTTPQWLHRENLERMNATGSCCDTRSDLVQDWPINTDPIEEPST